MELPLPHPRTEPCLPKSASYYGTSATLVTTLIAGAGPSFAEEVEEIVATGDARTLFNEGRALESQGDIAVAQRLYSKVTKNSAGFVNGWSNLGNALKRLLEIWMQRRYRIRRR
jgi:hypothetical protein